MIYFCTRQAICLLILTQLAIQIERGFEFCHQTPHVFCCRVCYVSQHFNQVHTPTKCSAIVTAAPLHFSEALHSTKSQTLTIARSTKFMLMLLVLLIYGSQCSEQFSPTPSRQQVKFRNVFYVHKLTNPSQGTELSGSQQQEVMM